MKSSRKLRKLSQSEQENLKSIDKEIRKLKRESRLLFNIANEKASRLFQLKIKSNNIKFQ